MAFPQHRHWVVDVFEDARSDHRIEGTWRNGRTSANLASSSTQSVRLWPNGSASAAMRSISGEMSQPVARMPDVASENGEFAGAAAKVQHVATGGYVIGDGIGHWGQAACEAAARDVFGRPAGGLGVE